MITTKRENLCIDDESCIQTVLLELTSVPPPLDRVPRGTALVQNLAFPGIWKRSLSHVCAIGICSFQAIRLAPECLAFCTALQVRA